MENKKKYVKELKKAIVILSLHSPKEKVWGLLLNINQAGVWIHGIDINSFEDWSRQIASKKDQSMGLSTMFFPMIRLEKIIVDENVGSVKSFSTQFFERVGKDVMEMINIQDLPIIPFIKDSG